MRFRTPIVPALLLVAVAAGCQQVNQLIEPEPPAVTVAKPLDEEVSVRIAFTGRTDARERVEIRARVEGFLATVDIDEGEVVDEGDTLFTIQRDTFEARVAVMQARLEQARAARSLAQVTVDRVTRAHERNAASEIEVLVAEAERDAALAAVQGAQADLDTANLDLGYTTITAPMDGRVSRRFVSAGNLVGKGEATLLTTLVADEPIYAYFTVNERFVVGMLQERPRGRRNIAEDPIPAFLELSDGSEYPREGKINFLDNTVDPETGSIIARAEFPNPDAALLPGLFARVLIPRQPRQVLLVPEAAMQRDQGGTFLLVAAADGMVDRRNVVPGDLIRARGLRIIESGLEADERVIVNGIQRARPGAKVNATDSTVEAFLESSRLGRDERGDAPDGGNGGEGGDGDDAAGSDETTGGQG